MFKKEVMFTSILTHTAKRRVSGCCVQPFPICKKSILYLLSIILTRGFLTTFQKLLKVGVQTSDSLKSKKVKIPCMLPLSYLQLRYFSNWTLPIWESQTVRDTFKQGALLVNPISNQEKSKHSKLTLFDFGFQRELILWPFVWIHFYNEILKSYEAPLFWPSCPLPGNECSGWSSSRPSSARRPMSPYGSAAYEPNVSSSCRAMQCQVIHTRTQEGSLKATPR